MNGFAIALLVLCAGALLVVPRRWASLPLLACACYMTLGQGILIGPFHFSVLRLILLCGFFRVVVKSEFIAGGLNKLDRMMISLGVVAIASGLFHDAPGDAIVFRLGWTYDGLGIYFLTRCFYRSPEDLVQFVKITGFILVPLALEMVYEKLTGHNIFSIFGGVPAEVVVRDGKRRASGPFLVSILAGTVGSVCIPLMVGIWRKHRISAILGLAASLLMVYASTSSGPIMSAAASVFALVLWRWRHLTRVLRWLAVFMYFVLDFIMQDPAYYILARIDLTGSSTGYHRARLIESAFEHLSEWWFAGTDYTRHWMETGVSWSPDHTDITNYYIKLGVIGGIWLMAILIVALAFAFQFLGRYLTALREDAEEAFLVWSVGASLFAHAVTCISVSYFDQSFLFLYTTLGIVGSLKYWKECKEHSSRDTIQTIPLLDRAGNAAEVPS